MLHGKKLPPLTGILGNNGGSPRARQHNPSFSASDIASSISLGSESVQEMFSSNDSSYDDARDGRNTTASGTKEMGKIYSNKSKASKASRHRAVRWARNLFSSTGSSRTRSTTNTDNFNCDENDLLDNSCSEALQRVRRRPSESSIENGLSTLGLATIFSESDGSQSERATSARSNKVKVMIDWSKQHNRERLKDLCKFIRRLFWAFEDAGGCLRRPVVPKSRAFEITSRVVRSDAFAVYFLIITIYALFGPDIASMYGYEAAYNTGLAIINTSVMFSFGIEAGLNSWVVDKYFLSGNFWIDIFATISIIGDTWIANELVQSDAAVAGRGTRVVRLVRIGGRSSRVVRLLRVFRIMQVVRLVPRMQQAMNRSTYELALLLLHKRLWHLFNCLDHRGSSMTGGLLSDTDLEFFHTALHMEFRDGVTSVAARPLNRLPKLPRSLSFRRQFTIGDSTDLRELKSFVRKEMARKSSATTPIEATFSAVVRNLMANNIGKAILQRCVEDIECMRDSCVLLQTSLTRISVKICLVVLSILILMPLLDVDVNDVSREQGLASLDSLKYELNTLMNGTNVLENNTFCYLVNRYAMRDGGENMELTLVIIDSIVFLDTVIGAGCHEKNLRLEEPPLDYANKMIEQMDLQPPEIILDCYPDTECDDRNLVRSLSVWDAHKENMLNGRTSLVFTSVIIVLLTCLILYFTLQMKSKSNTDVFHPLWDLMDDMCALKSMEVVAVGPSIDEGAPTAETVLKDRFRRCFDAEKPEPAGELIQLQDAFIRLRSAILTWGKYVPAILLKQLYDAGIEAEIGCSYSDVTVFFCDIANFQEICDGKKPEDVLSILEVILEYIHSVIEEHSGTLLEFIGDEVMAVYSAPAKVPNHTNCALLAATKIIEKIREIEFRPRVQCGVHRARVLAGNLGSPTRMKYGLMGDGVNLTARLKSLNSRYGTQILVSSDALDFQGSEDAFVTRPIGNLVLKGRNSPTSTFEILGHPSDVMPYTVEGAEIHTRAFRLFERRSFGAAASLFAEAHSKLSVTGLDRPSQHLRELCEKYVLDPPDDDWDGSEVLAKKAW